MVPKQKQLRKMNKHDHQKVQKFPFPTKSLAKMAAEDVQDHLLTTWSFISQFGDVLGLFPRRQKNESDSETDDDLDEERYNDEVVTKPSTAQSGKANGSKTKKRGHWTR